MSTPTQYCTFHVAGLFLGVDVLSVQEVLRATELARVPLAPATVEGLLNLRGQIVTTIDLRRRLSFEPRAADAEPMFMIVHTTDGYVALVVDSVGDVIEVNDDTYEPTPETLSAPARALVTGVHKLPGRLLHLLDATQAATLPAHAA
jgi:purine-binding chemotaxis protein CheW